MATEQLTRPASAHVEREARKLLALRDQWVWARNRQTGVSFIAIPSPCSDRRCPAGPEAHSHIRRVHPAGKGCDCPATQIWNAATCKHRVAVQMANDEDAAAEAPAPVKPLLTAEQLWPTCRARGCQNDPEPGERDCYRHQLVDAF